MRWVSLIAAALAGFGASAMAAEQPSQPLQPPVSGSTSSELSRSGGVIKPPAQVDPAMKQSPPLSGDRMPVIPPPGTPGGNPSIKPK